MMKKTLSIGLAAILLSPFAGFADSYTLLSPNGQLSVVVSDEGGLTYSVRSGADTVLLPSPLGLYRADLAHTSAPHQISSASTVTEGRTAYTNPRGKQSRIDKPYRTQRFEVADKGYSVELRLYDDGLGYRYILGGNSPAVTIINENSGFTFVPEAKCYLSQISKGKSGWQKTNPSYEDHYHYGVGLDEESEHRQGWVFPALVNVGSHWALLSETGLTSSYVGSHLSEGLDNTLMTEFPHADHNHRYDPVTPTLRGGDATPWRMIAVGDLVDIVASTLADDLVDDLTRPTDATLFAPGKSSWSWLVLNDTYTTFDGTHEFIDLAADLNFNYCLIDAAWDRQIGREKMKELADYAKTKGVGLLVWYNSNGDWNTTGCTPTDLMLDPAIREREMQWMQELGIKGIKVDFFGGDKQTSMEQYEGILKDAERYGLAVNFHGATLPRGWSRIYPAFMTAEAVLGQEFCKGVQENEDLRPQHCAMLPFARNVVAPADFTPVVLRERLGELPETGPQRATTAAFELALPVVLFSPITHFGITPTDIAPFGPEVKAYFRQLPTVWDETRLLSGFPGRDVVIARRSGNSWYVAGINGENVAKQLPLDLSFAPKAKRATLYQTTGAAARNSISARTVNLKKEALSTIDLAGNDGFVLVIE